MEMLLYKCLEEIRIGPEVHFFFQDLKDFYIEFYKLLFRATEVPSSSPDVVPLALRCLELMLTQKKLVCRVCLSPTHLSSLWNVLPAM